MTVPLLDLKAQFAKIRPEIEIAIKEVCESQHFILGPRVEELENKIAAYSGAKYGVGVSSGTDALLAALMALDIRPDDEVITTPFTFFATAGAIARLNARPVFVDIDPVSFNIDPSKIEKAITKRTKAIIPVHLFGQCAAMDPIMKIANKYRLLVIEDAAQSIGAEYKGKRCGSIGHLGCFSFFPSKNLGAFGDGGMVVTNDVDLCEKGRIIRVHGSKPKYYHKIVGGNFRLDSLQAAIINVKLTYLDEWSQLRRNNADYYNKAIMATGLVGKGFIVLPTAVYRGEGDSHYHTYNQYTIRAKERDKLQAFLRESGVGTEVYYPIPLHVQPCFLDLGFKKGDFPEAERASREVLSIPIYPELSNEQKEYVISKMSEFYR